MNLSKFHGTVVKTKNYIISPIFAKLPYELKLYIFAYARKSQPRRLLRDIENFSYSWEILKNAYYRVWVDEWGETEEDAHSWIHNDIVRYVNENHPTRSIYTSRFFDYWERLFSINTRNDVIQLNDKLLDILRNSAQNGEDPPPRLIERISRNMWALLLPYERCSFLSNYLNTENGVI